MKDNILQVNIEKAIRSQTADLELKQLSTLHEVRSAIRWVMRDNPDIFWFAHQYHFDETRSIIHFQYTFSAERVKTIQQCINDVIDNDFCIEYVKTLLMCEQIVYVYKWLVTYCNYNANSAYNQSIYSVFIRRNSVCTGYAKAAQYLFYRLGIESRLVFGRLHNDKEDGRHCWNLVKVENDYFHFDASFGDSILDKVAIKSGVHELIKIDGINYNFLCVSTDEILKTRSIEDIATLPKCYTSWHNIFAKSLAKIKVKQREGIKGCQLSCIGSSADIHLCTKEKNTVLKVFRPNSKTTSSAEYRYMQQTRGCQHLLQCNEEYTDIALNYVAIEQATPIVDLLCSHYYELSLRGLIKMATDVAIAWKECHDRGVLYRDIHICNIYRSNDGTFKLGDFGSCTNNYDIKETVGNQWFMAPETFVSGVFTESSAVYSISMVMYFILNNLRPAFWTQGCEDEALQKRLNGDFLPIPAGCFDLPVHVKARLDEFFRNASASLPKERINRITVFIYELERLAYCCENRDYTIHRKGYSLDFDLDAGNDDRLDARWRYIPRDAYHRYTMGDDIERECSTVYMVADDCICYDTPPLADDVEDFAITAGYNDVLNDISFAGSELNAGEVEAFARTMAAKSEISEDELKSNAKCDALKVSVQGSSYILSISKRKLDGSSSNSETINTQNKTFDSRPDGKKVFWWNKIFGNKYKVYSSIFAPAEVKRKSHLLVQVYLHLYEETEKVKSQAKEPDKNAERRGYIPLALKLRKGDKVDVEINVCGEEILMFESKSVIWQGHYTNCSFDYYVPEDIREEQLSCKILLSVNGIPVGEMRFITDIVTSPTDVNPEIISRTFNKIFISYAHQDEPKVKFLAEGFKMMKADYFFDRHYLKAGDIFPQKIQDYISKADLFILCWSENASKSEYVEKERTQALERAYPKVQPADQAELSIYPLNIEPHAELPSDMKGYYHFVRI